MKKIVTSLAVVTAVSAGAFAQKNVDLGFAITTPTEMGVYPNVAELDSFNIKIAISNSGTDAVAPTDTIQMWMAGYAVNISQNQLTWMGRRITGLNIPAGQTAEYSYWVVKGSGVVTGNNDTIINWFFDNDTNQIKVEGYGWDNNDVLFNDPGVDNANPEGENGLTGNNSTAVRSYILGTTNPNSIKSIFAKNEALNVFPNPTTGAVNINYNFKNAAEATVKVTDIAGRQVYANNFGKVNAGAQTLNINLSNLAAGVYTIELNAGEVSASSKINIKK
jgi:hypothetical protein